MSLTTENKSNNRLAIAGALFLTSIIASFAISYFANSGSHYWVLKQPLSRGVQITASDIALVKIALGNDVRGYIPGTSNPVGSITRRSLLSGELLNSNDISSNSEGLTTESLSISIRAADIPQSTLPGDLVSLYQVFDARNGEVVTPPQHVISGVFIKEIARKSANFGSDLSLTITVQREDVPLVLIATSSGRIVVVASHG
ncbi:MAG: SAF domain-containing protein [Candidatus Planktophila sp.]